MSHKIIIIPKDQFQSVKDIQQWVQTLDVAELQGTLLLIEPFGFENDTLRQMVEHHQNQLDTTSLLSSFVNGYMALVRELLGVDTEVMNDINDDLIEVEWTLEDPPEDDAAFVRDQILTVAAVVSSKIIAAFLVANDIGNQWIDARDLFVADNNYGAGNLLIEDSSKRCHPLVDALNTQSGCLITQGGVACTTENFNITLGEKGSAKAAQFLATQFTSSLIF